MMLKSILLSYYIYDPLQIWQNLNADAILHLPGMGIKSKLIKFILIANHPL